MQVIAEEAKLPNNRHHIINSYRASAKRKTQDQNQNLKMTYKGRKMC